MPALALGRVPGGMPLARGKKGLLALSRESFGRYAHSLLLTPPLIAEDEPGGNEATIKSLARGGSVFEGDLCGDDV